MTLDNSIGGYFELETHDFGSAYHDKAIAVNSARNALEYILLINNYKKIFIPYYTCDVILQPLKKLNIKFEFYNIKSDFSPGISSIKEGEVLLYVNYFGVMNHVIEGLRSKYKNLIIDNAQAFFSKPLKNISTIYSPRKFFGIPDGGFVYLNKEKRLKLDIDSSNDRFSHLIVRVENGAEEGYNIFKENDLKLDDLPLKNMSNLTKKLLHNINFNKVIEKRNKNFKFLHQSLKEFNELTPLIEKEILDGPMVYPFLRKKNEILRNKLIQNKIFVARYWPNVIDWVENSDCIELHLYNNLLPLPIDQRYGENEMKKVLEVVLKNQDD